MTAASPPDTLALARRIADLILEKRGTDLVLLDVRTLVDYTDFFLLASGQSGRQNQAIGEHVVRTLKADHRYAISKSGLDTGSWICLDMGDVVVHVFDAETRARYDLELLWADAPRIELASKPVPADAVPAAESAAGSAAPEKDAAEKPKRRKRVARKAAVEDADADNAPDSARPPIDQPEPDDGKTPPPSDDDDGDEVPAPKKAKKKPVVSKGPAPRGAKAKTHAKAPAPKKPTRAFKPSKPAPSAKRPLTPSKPSKPSKGKPKRPRG